MIRSPDETLRRVTFEHLFSREVPRDPGMWAAIEAQPVGDWAMDPEVVGMAISGLAKAAGLGVIEKARAMGVKLPPQLDDPNVEITGELIIEVLRDVSWHLFPGLAPAGPGDGH